MRNHAHHACKSSDAQNGLPVIPKRCPIPQKPGIPPGAGRCLPRRSLTGVRKIELWKVLRKWPVAPSARVRANTTEGRRIVAGFFPLESRECGPFLPNVKWRETASPRGRPFPLF